MSESISEFRGRFRFLSNFYAPAFGVILDGETYKTVEHAYQAAKTFDKNERTAIRLTSKPGEAKRHGRHVKLRTDWESVKLDLMLDLVRQKFKDATLCEMLLETGDSQLIEGNDWGDFFWGVCGGKGQNHLGKILMRVREELRGAAHPSKGTGRDD